MEDRCDSRPPGVDFGAVRVLTGSLYWKKWGKANHVWIEPVSSLPAISYCFARRSLASGLAGLPTLSVRSIQIRAALLGVPVVVDLADDQCFRPGLGDVGELEGAVGLYVELAVVVGQHRGGCRVGAVGTAHDLEGEVGRGAADAADDVLDALLEVGVEVDGVGVVEALLRELVRRVDEQRPVEVVVERHLQGHPDPPGQVVVALEQVLLGLDELGSRDQLLGLGDGVAQGRGEVVAHPFTFAMIDSPKRSRCSIFFSRGSSSGPLMYGTRKPTMQSVTPLSSRRFTPSGS